jgi:hypothetical protein
MYQLVVETNGIKECFNGPTEIEAYAHYVLEVGIYERAGCDIENYNDSFAVIQSDGVFREIYVRYILDSDVEWE